MRRSIAMTAALAALAPAVAGAHAVDFHIVEQEVSVDRTAKVAEFTVTFSRMPIFVTAETHDADMFQYEIDADSTDTQSSLGWEDIDVVIRGGEIWEGNGIPVREPAGDEPDRDAGGWGPVRALLPFELDDKTITFSAPLEALADSDGSFRYRAFAIDNGAMTGEVIGAVIPTPAALGPGLAMLAGVLALRSMRRRLI